MIEPQAGQRGVIGEQHGLTRLTTTLERIEAGQRAQQLRETQLQTQLATQAATLHHMGRWLRWQGVGLSAIAVLLMTVGGLVGWQIMHPPQMQYAQTLGALDATLTQSWNSLPKPVQEQLAATYGRLGMPGPGPRAK